MLVVSFELRLILLRFQFTFLAISLWVDADSDFGFLVLEVDALLRATNILVVEAPIRETFAIFASIAAVSAAPPLVGVIFVPSVMTIAAALIPPAIATFY